MQKLNYIALLLSLLILTYSCLLLGISVTSSELSLASSSSKHMVLVHGACHGAWSWYKLVPPLKSAGFNVTALDLAASGIDPRQENSLKSISDYIKPLRDFMASLPSEDKIVLVGHSYGGYAISQAMERFPDKISVAVFLAAGMPGPDLNVSTLAENIYFIDDPMDTRLIYDDGPDQPPTASVPGPKFLAAKTYKLSPPEDLALATMLVRPQRVFSIEDMSRELVLTRERYGKVSRVYIDVEHDLANKEGIQWMIQHNKPNQVEEIKGSDHMAMMSKPVQLFNLLVTIAMKYSPDPAGARKTIS